jgi:hypothetical protein
MAHFKTSDNEQSYCSEHDEFDVYVSGETVSNGPQPNDYCMACREVEPTWEILSEDEFLKRWPL